MQPCLSLCKEFASMEVNHKKRKNHKNAILEDTLQFKYA
jgi:hypothetical protein